MAWEIWREEVPWMTLYFSIGVWPSLAMGSCNAILRSATTPHLAPGGRCSRKYLAINR